MNTPITKYVYCSEVGAWVCGKHRLWYGSSWRGQFWGDHVCIVKWDAFCLAHGFEANQSLNASFHKIQSELWPPSEYTFTSVSVFLSDLGPMPVCPGPWRWSHLVSVLFTLEVKPVPTLTFGRDWHLLTTVFYYFPGLQRIGYCDEQSDRGRKKTMSAPHDRLCESAEMQLHSDRLQEQSCAHRILFDVQSAGNGPCGGSQMVFRKAVKKREFGHETK